VKALLFGLLGVTLLQGVASAEPQVAIGSKAFPESWILGEAIRAELRRAGIDAEHQQNLGGTEIAYAALQRGSIDVYPEYTGTIAEVLLKTERRADISELRRRLAPLGLSIAPPLGFANSYAIAASTAGARRCSLQRLSALARCKDLTLGLSHEFLGRSDGWPKLSAFYGLDLGVRAMQHELAYEAVASGAVEAIDVYTTDPQIDKLGLVVLEDDKGFFPSYDAVLLYRADLRTRVPSAVAVFERLAGTIDESAMRRANRAVVLEQKSPVEGAALLVGGSSAPHDAGASTLVANIAAHTARHLQLVLTSLIAAILVGLPLGIWAARSRWLRAIALGTASVLQTIPSLALLAVLIPLLGIGFWPALAALFLYGLLPIVRNTCVALDGLPRTWMDAAVAMGLSRRTRLWRVELPLASGTILAGIRISAVINVGTATLAALIGAGGLGSPILQGIALRDHALIWQGALPVAVLALLLDGALAGLERVIVPRGLRLASARTERS
jgi:osmoprotectant transport system permease protein